MTDRYALPWPPDADPPEPQQSLWIPSCPRCGGAGVVRLEVDGADPDDWYTCRECGGSGVEGGELAARRLRGD